MQRTDPHNCIYAILLHRYIRACQQDTRGRVTTAAATALWRFACNQGLRPASSLTGLGFTTVQDTVQALPDARAEQLTQSLKTDLEALRVFYSLQNRIEHITPNRLNMLLI